MKLNIVYNLFNEDNSSAYADGLLSSIFSNNNGMFEKSGINFNKERYSKSIKLNDLRISDAKTEIEFAIERCQPLKMVNFSCLSSL